MGKKKDGVFSHSYSFPPCHFPGPMISFADLVIEPGKTSNIEETLFLQVRCFAPNGGTFGKGDVLLKFAETGGQYQERFSIEESVLSLNRDRMDFKVKLLAGIERELTIVHRTCIPSGDCDWRAYLMFVIRYGDRISMQYIILNNFH